MSVVRKTKIVVTTKEILIANHQKTHSICPLCKSDLAKNLRTSTAAKEPTLLINTSEDLNKKGEA